MKGFITGEDRRQITLLPDCLDDFITADNLVRLVEVFVDELDLGAPGFAGAVPEAAGRPAYHLATLLKIYLNRVPSSRRLERESQRNIELIWLTGRLMPDFKTLADFRKDNCPAIQAASAHGGRSTSSDAASRPLMAAIHASYRSGMFHLARLPRCS